jgi:hypothetical protein
MHLIRAWLAARVAELRENDDRGDIVQTVIIVAAFAAAAILIVGILVAKATSAANSVETQ